MKILETHNKVGWIVAILVFALGMGCLLSGGTLEYDKVEITPAIDAVYELIPLTPAQTFGELLSVVAFYTMAALLLGGFVRLMILDAAR